MDKNQKKDKELRNKKIRYWVKRIALGIFCALIAMLLLLAVFEGWLSKN